LSTAPWFLPREKYHVGRTTYKPKTLYVAKLRARNIAAEFRQIPDGDHDSTPSKPETVSAIKELLKP
jgi:hypothetical protein